MIDYGSRTHERTPPDQGLRHARGREARARAAGARKDQNVRLWRDRLRPHSYRPRPRLHCLRCRAAILLRHAGYDVTYVRNHTDVDDKIIARANEVGEDPLALAQRFIEELDEDMDATPRAARRPSNPRSQRDRRDHRDERAAAREGPRLRGRRRCLLSRRLVRRTTAKLSGRKLEDMEAGRSGRVGEDSESKKENPFDFALWKKSKADDI